MPTPPPLLFIPSLPNPPPLGAQGKYPPSSFVFLPSASPSILSHFNSPYLFPHSPLSPVLASSHPFQSCSVHNQYHSFLSPYLSASPLPPTFLPFPHFSFIASLSSHPIPFSLCAYRTLTPCITLSSCLSTLSDSPPYLICSVYFALSCLYM
jgi:hypothetical protein